MYVRIVEINAPTKLQLNVFLDYLKTSHFPKNLKEGQISAKVFSINDKAAFVIAKFNDKKSSDKIKIMNNSEINELKTNLKIKSFEGSIEYSLE